MKMWKNIRMVIAVLSVITLGHVSLGSAADENSIEQMITEAKTPADHEAIAAHYEKEAQAAHQQHAKHQKMRDLYGATPALKTKSGTLFTHCDNAAKKYEEIAQEYEALAKMHREMATSAK
jgi:hypothetical protein